MSKELKVKVGVLSDFKDGQMKEVSVGSGKVLLSQVDGTIFATSHLCPHYKAPLVKGVLSPDGRVVCPWHGACFDVKTGDIEDAPSLDALQKYQVMIDGTDVYVSFNEENLKSNKRIPVCKKTLKKTAKTAVIVGGGAAGIIAAETLRLEGYSGRVIMVSREDYLPIDRPKLSKSLKIDSSKIQLRSQDYFNQLDIEINLSTEVVSVDCKKKSVTLNSGKNISYDSLILATGGDPHIFGWPGKNLENIFVVRNVEHVNAIESALSKVSENGTKKPNVVIVGSSFIGMEAASVLAKQASVTVIGMEKIPFERVLGTEVGAALGNLTQKNGVILKMESSVEKFISAESDNARVGFVVLSKTGEKLPADIVILGAGVAPKTDYLKNSDIKLDKDGGISVRATMQVPDVQNVFAVGDIARYNYHLTNENVRVEHWNVAQNQGRVAARNIIAMDEDKEACHVFTQIPYFWTVLFGKSIRYCGHAESFDDVIIQGSLEMDESGGGMAFVAFYTRNDIVLAVCSLGKDPVVSHASELMRLKKMPTASEIKKGLDLLSIPLGAGTVFFYKAKMIKGKSKSNIWLYSLVMPAVAFLVWMLTFKK